ncbi:class I SAM-dependent methyltransferase [Luminiphilus sp. nBUS_07]|uniref:class I SAM-dependent methyltransferase n=1 Tax=Luminiphilus sp. nBUS_07 TaxID=3395314 RepID=UPI003EBB7858
MEIVERLQCAISGHSDLELLHNFPDFPVFMGCLDQAKELDLKQDMSWWISKGSGLIQLKKLLPLDVLYPESHGAGVVGALWEKHHEAFAAFVNRTKPKSVLEIGGAHGILERDYQHFGEIPWTILEPNPSPVEGCKAHFIKGFFDEQFKHEGVLDTVVHSHVFEHIYEPEAFMRQLSGFMAPGNQLIFSLPNMQAMLERKYTNCINFEHTVFLTEPYVEYLLARHGFKSTYKEYFMDDHSIFYSATRDEDIEPMPLPQGLYEKNKTLYMDYINYHRTLIVDLNKKMSETTQPIYLFGAHVFAQYLLEMGLNGSKIVSLLDNDASKQGRRLYGTELKVASPQALREVSNPIVILKAGVYNDEIKKDILGNINKSTVFFE